MPEPKKRQLLRVKRIDTIGLVDRGDNPEADIVFWKRDVSKATKTEDGESYPASAFAYVPDAEKPSTWKLRLWESPSEKVTARQVGAALAALSPGGYRGNRVSIPAADLAGVKAKVKAAWHSVHGKDDELPSVLKVDPEAVTPPANDLGAARAADPGTAKENHMDELEKAQADLTAARAEVETLKAEVGALKAKAPAEKKDVLKGLSPEARAEVEAELKKRDEETKTLRKSHEALVEKMDRDAIAIRFAKGGDFEGLGGEKRTDIVLAAKKAMGAEDFTALDTMLKAAAEQIRKGALFAELGKSGDATNETAMAKIEAKAKAEKREGETVQQAIARITKENPDLYREYEQERKAR